MGEYLTIEEIRALALIMLVTWGATETAKRAARSLGQLRGQWSPRAVAFGVGLAGGLWMWPPGSSIAGWQAGLAVGAAWPAVYAAAVSAIRLKWPAVADAISGSRSCEP